MKLTLMRLSCGKNKLSNTQTSKVLLQLSLNSFLDTGLDLGILLCEFCKYLVFKDCGFVANNK